MFFRKYKWIYLVFLVVLVFFGASIKSKPTKVIAQQPTGSIPTVTGTPKGVTAKIKPGSTSDSVNVRTGPSVLYPEVGIILTGSEVSVIGKSAGGDWLVIQYPGVAGGIGWVFANMFQVSPGEIPIVESPPSPVPITTVTLDQTMAAQFITTPEATRLPTFTAPPPLVIPTYEVSTGQVLGGLPIGMIIIILAVLSGLVGLFTYFQSR